MGTNPLSGQAQPVSRGDPISARMLNRVGEALFQEQLMLPAPFSYGGRFPGGSVAVPFPQKSGGSSTTIFPPWYPFLGKNSSGNYTLNFYPGTIAGLLATNWNSPLALTQNVVNYIYLAVTASGGNISAATITAATTYPTLASANSGSPPTSFNIPIAVVDLSQSSPVPYNVIGFGNIWAATTPILFDTINTGAPLTAPFTPWYNWIWGAGQD